MPTQNIESFKKTEIPRNDQSFDDISLVLESILFLEDDHWAASIFIENLVFFERLMSLDSHRDKLMYISFSFIRSNDFIIFQDGSSLLRKIQFYLFLYYNFESIMNIVNQDLSSENNDQIFQSCMVLYFFWRI